jgi:hypothetical protein
MGPLKIEEKQLVGRGPKFPAHIGDNCGWADEAGNLLGGRCWDLWSRRLDGTRADLLERLLIAA